MKKKIAILLALVMVIALAAGCAKTGSETSPAASSAASSEAASSSAPASSSAAESSAATGGTIKIGIGCPLTGTTASYGELMKFGAELAAERLNKAGGIKGQKVEIVAYDDKGDPKEAALVAQRFCDNKEIFAVISHGGSSLTLAAAPIYEAAKMTNMAPSSSNAKVTEMGYQYVVRHVIRDDRQSPQVIAMMANNLKLKDIAIVYGNNDYGRGNLDYATQAAKQLGVNIVASETYNPGLEKDFTALLTKIQKSGAKGVALYADYSDAGLILGQAKQLGMDDTIWVGQSSLTYKKLVELATPEALQNVYMLVTFNPYDTGRAEVKEFMDLFQAQRKGEIPSEPCAFSYDIVNVFAAAIEQGATKENLAQFIKNLVPGQQKFAAKNILLGSEVVWDEKGDVTPRGVDVLKVNEKGDFINTDIKVDITGIKMAGVVE